MVQLASSDYHAPLFTTLFLALDDFVDFEWTAAIRTDDDWLSFIGAHGRVLRQFHGHGIHHACCIAPLSATDFNDSLPFHLQLFKRTSTPI